MNNYTYLLVNQGIIEEEEAFNKNKKTFDKFNNINLTYKNIRKMKSDKWINKVKYVKSNIILTTNYI